MDRHDKQSSWMTEFNLIESFPFKLLRQQKNFCLQIWRKKIIGSLMMQDFIEIYESKKSLIGYWKEKNYYFGFLFWSVIFHFEFCFFYAKILLLNNFRLKYWNIKLQSEEWKLGLIYICIMHCKINNNTNIVVI